MKHQHQIEDDIKHQHQGGIMHQHLFQAESVAQRKFERETRSKHLLVAWPVWMQSPVCEWRVPCHHNTRLYKNVHTETASATFLDR